MSFNNILYAVDDRICTITINRPEKLNALNIETIQEIKTAVDNAVNDVCEGKKMGGDGHGVFNSIEHSPKPIIAAINGFALGGGCEIAMACHMRVASAKAKFGQPEINLGIIPGYGGTQRLVRYIGKTKATELLLTGDMITAEDAYRLGLVNYVTEPEVLLEKCREILNKIVTKSPLVVAQILKLANAYYAGEEKGFHDEINEFGNCFNTEDFKEGVSAFLEKRKANFTGN
ncbi:MAG: enoyl-CoA hydratase-related protein [Bacteroidetes bacterium]|nr:enoyl-CoA hydratase-related protein [Bacteroidota bacterium]